MPCFGNIPGETTQVSQSASAELHEALSPFMEMLSAAERGDLTAAEEAKTRTLSRLSTAIDDFQIVVNMARDDAWSQRAGDSTRDQENQSLVERYSLTLTPNRQALADLALSEVRRFRKVVEEADLQVIDTSPDTYERSRANVQNSEVWSLHDRLNAAVVRLITVGNAISGMSAP